MPSVSVILPTYNARPFLPEQVQSILHQEFGDFELLLVDDGSSDGTESDLAYWASADSRVRVLDSHGNRGQKARLAQLVDASRGGLIAIADQDDIWHPQKLSVLMAALGSRAMVFGSSWIIDNAGVELGRTLLDFIQPLPQAEDKLIYLFKPAVSGHASLAIRRLALGMSLSRSEPFDWLQALEAVFSDGLAYVPEAITYHRLHGGNQSNATSATIPTFWHKMQPRYWRRARNGRHLQRFTLHQRLEHLAFSKNLDAGMNRVFAKAAGLCHDAWFGLDRRMALRNVQLEEQLSELLQPLAGSERDWRFARKKIVNLCRSNYNPYDMARRTATMFLTPSHMRGAAQKSSSAS